jgi:hypothetical protein
LGLQLFKLSMQYQLSRVIYCLKKGAAYEDIMAFGSSLD